MLPAPRAGTAAAGSDRDGPGPGTAALRSDRDGPGSRLAPACPVTMGKRVREDLEFFSSLF